MSANVDALIVAPKKLWRSVVVIVPFRNAEDSLVWNTDVDWRAKDRLKLFAKRVALLFQLPKTRVTTHMIRHEFCCYLPIYQGEGTRAERRLFKEVRAYAEKHAPRAGGKRTSKVFRPPTTLSYTRSSSFAVP